MGNNTNYVAVMEKQAGDTSGACPQTADRENLDLSTSLVMKTVIFIILSFLKEEQRRKYWRQ